MNRRDFIQMMEKVVGGLILAPSLPDLVKPLAVVNNATPTGGYYWLSYFAKRTGYPADAYVRAKYSATGEFLEAYLNGEPTDMSCGLLPKLVGGNFVWPTQESIPAHAMIDDRFFTYPRKEEHKIASVLCEVQAEIDIQAGDR